MLTDIKVGDQLELNEAGLHKRYKDFETLRDSVLCVEGRFLLDSVVMFRFKNVEGHFWSGFFRKRKVRCKFSVGDKVKYTGVCYENLKNKELTVHWINSYGRDGTYCVARLDKDPHSKAIVEDVLEKITPNNRINVVQTKHLPQLNDVLLDFSYDGKLTKESKVHVHVLNLKINGDSCHNGNDIMTVIRTMQENNVHAEVKFNSSMYEAITVEIDGQDFISELGNPKHICTPIKAITTLGNKLEVTITVEGQDDVLCMEYGGQCEPVTRSRAV
jgi:hypothetical protein